MSQQIRQTTVIVGESVAGLPVPDEGEPELVVLPDPAAVAAEAAERIARALVDAVAGRGRADFCTTGGSTVVAIYRLLACAPLCERIPWDRVHVWWGDDRFVPRGHPESDVTPLDAVLLARSSGEDGAQLPAANIHPFPIGLALARGRDADWCAARYAEEMAAQLSLADGHWPTFDLIMAGAGNDGHILSCFRNSPALDSMAWAMGIPAPSHIGPHLPRVTLNPRILEAAPVMIPAWGAAKAAALGNVFGVRRDLRRWPAQRTRRPGAVWLVDRAAASLIPTEPPAAASLIHPARLGPV